MLYASWEPLCVHFTAGARQELNDQVVLCEIV
eukprot:COSAG02_NODE_64025_length_261_cov_1.271605_1_plen_31_part_10